MTPLRVSICGELADVDVLRLRFRDAQLRLEPARVGHPREVLAGRHPLPDFDGHLLQHAGEPGAHLAAPPGGSAAGRRWPAPGRPRPAARASRASIESPADASRLRSISNRVLQHLGCADSACFSRSSEMSSSFASASLASASICACLKSASTVATCACCVSSSFWSCTRRFSSAASADWSASRALSASCSTCGLLSSRMTESAAPAPRAGAGCARRARRSWRAASACPRARACRARGPGARTEPRLTVSMRSVARSTVGAAGSMRASATEMRTTAMKIVDGVRAFDAGAVGEGTRGRGQDPRSTPASRQPAAAQPAILRPRNGW